MKKVVVTGASGGMGLATCKLLCENGFEVYGLDYRAPEVKVDWTYIYTDLTSLESVEKSYYEIKQHTDNIDAIIHLAGKYDLNSLIEMPEKDFKNIFDINVFAIYRVNKVFVPILNKPGRVVITASELAPLDPLPFTGIYGITKTTIEKYCFSLRMELQLLGHQVIELRPGAVSTGLLNVSRDRIDNFAENTILYKFSGSNFRDITEMVESRSIPPEDIAKLVLKVITVKHPKFIYNINRNKLLLLLNALPDRFQTFIIKQILITDRKKKRNDDSKST